jgi:hypothetical protein
VLIDDTFREFCQSLISLLLSSARAASNSSCAEAVVRHLTSAFVRLRATFPPEPTRLRVRAGIAGQGRLKATS